MASLVKGEKSDFNIIDSDDSPEASNHHDDSLSSIYQFIQFITSDIESTASQDFRYGISDEHQVVLMASTKTAVSTISRFFSFLGQGPPENLVNSWLTIGDKNQQ